MRVTVIGGFGGRGVGLGAHTRGGASSDGAGHPTEIQSQRLSQMRRGLRRLRGIGLHGERDVAGLNRRSADGGAGVALVLVLLIRRLLLSIGRSWIELFPRDVDDVDLLRIVLLLLLGLLLNIMCEWLLSYGRDVVLWKDL